MVLQFYFFLNHILRKTVRTLGEPLANPQKIYVFFLKKKNSSNSANIIKQIMYFSHTKKIYENLISSHSTREKTPTIS